MASLMITTEIDTVLFDLDGTLVNSIGILQETYFGFLSMHGATGSLEEFNRLNGPSLKEIVEYLRTQYAIPLSSEDVMSGYISVLKDAYSHRAMPLDGAQEILEHLHQRGLTLALVTSTPNALVNCFTEKHDWNRFFKVIVSGDEVPQSKPSPEIYRLAIQRLALDPQQCVVVEDSVNGVRSACGAGLKVIGLADNETSAAALLEAGAATVVPGLRAIHDQFAALEAV